jgi:hypothetical protein
MAMAQGAMSLVGGGLILSVSMCAGGRAGYLSLLLEGSIDRCSVPRAMREILWTM